MIDLSPAPSARRTFEQHERDLAAFEHVVLTAEISAARREYRDERAAGWRVEIGGES